jgi:hypothetical protein
MAILLIALLLIPVSGFAQKRDTLQTDVGNPGGFCRIREFHPNGKFSKVWFTDWNKDGSVTKSFSQYNRQGIRIVNADSTFAARGNLLKVQRKLGDTIEGEETEFDSYGNVSTKRISIYYEGKYVIFIRAYNASAPFYAVVDGNPPQRMQINPEGFFEAERIFNEKVFKHSISN